MQWKSLCCQGRHAALTHWPMLGMYLCILKTQCSELWPRRLPEPPFTILWLKKKGSTWPIYTPLLELKNSLRSDVTTPVSPMVTPPIAIYKTPMLMQLLLLYDLSCEFETFGLFLCRQPLKLQINMFLYLQEQITMLRTMHRNCDACEFRSVIPLM